MLDLYDYHIPLFKMTSLVHFFPIIVSKLYGICIADMPNTKRAKKGIVYAVIQVRMLISRFLSLHNCKSDPHLFKAYLRTVCTLNNVGTSWFSCNCGTCCTPEVLPYLSTVTKCPRRPCELLHITTCGASRNYTTVSRGEPASFLNINSPRSRLRSGT